MKFNSIIMFALLSSVMFIQEICSMKKKAREFINNIDKSNLKECINNINGITDYIIEETDDDKRLSKIDQIYLKKILRYFPSSLENRFVKEWPQDMEETYKYTNKFKEFKILLQKNE